MGFGYLFFGYLISLNFFAYDALTTPLALVFMLRGMLSLGRFNRPLREGYILLWPTLVLSLFSFFIELARMLGLLSTTRFQSINAWVSFAVPFLLLLFTWRMLCGLAALAKETELPKLAYRAKRNLLFTLISYTAYLFFSLPIEADWYTAATAHAFLPVLLCHFIVLLLNAILIYSCYMWICLPQDLDMQRKKTGIAFLDDLKEKMDKQEEAAQAKKKQALADLYHKREAKYHKKHDKEKGEKKK